MRDEGRGQLKGSLLDLRSLEDSPTVANCRMNREREIRGTNSYAADLGFDVIQFVCERLERRESVAWLDLCCGSGRALIQAAECFRDLGLANRVSLLGLDLVDLFAAVPAGIENLTFVAASVHDWEPAQAFDLVTCVHGLHYVGDKLNLIARAASWLRPDGLFAAHLDLNNVKLVEPGGLAPSSHEPPGLSRGSGPLTPGPSPARGEGWKMRARSANALLGKEFKRLGLEYDRRRHIVACRGQRRIEFPFRYLGADDEAGPNFTQQPAVDSYYER
jgi:SAM-dependent methyltransferase